MINFKRNSIQIKLILFFTFLALALFASVGLLFFRSTKVAINTSKENELTTLSQETANKIDRFIFERKGDIQVMADSPLLKDNRIEKGLKLDYLESVRKAYKTYDYIFITNLTGNIEVLSGELKGDKTFEKFLPQVLKGNFYISDFIYKDENRANALYFAAPILDTNGIIVGAVVERMNFNSINEIVKNVKFGDTGYAYIVDDKGNNLIKNSKELKLIPKDIQDKKVFYSKYNGLQLVSSYYPITKYETQSNNSFLVVEEPVKEAFQVTSRLGVYTIIVVFISITALFVLGVFMSRQITNPIKKLMKETKDIAEGGVGQAVEVGTVDEIGSVAQSFNIMIGNLKAMMQQVLEISGEAASLSEVRDYADKYFENIPNGIITVDNLGKVTTFNSEAALITGISTNEIVGMNIKTIKNQDIMPVTKLLSEGIGRGKIYIKHILSIKNKENKEIPIMVNTSIQKDISGKLIGVIAVFRRVDEIKKFEESVIRAKNLESLGVLSAGMAHEIRNPLTSIKGYAQYIKLELGEDSELNGDVSIIISEVDRLNNIIDRFLTFARPKKLNVEASDINEIFNNICNVIKKETEHNKIEVVTNYDSLPLINIDYEQMEQAFLNIIVNSIQAMSKGGILEINTKHIKHTNDIVVIIRDTGAGINPDDYDKIFEPFFTTKDKGTGLGLAICSRIIESHKGFIEVSSTLGRGTKFTINLPIKNNLIGD